ncbi:hypothetical protein JCM19037_2283 [Geomicrobium sp. JCM 19037]|uniref:acyl dehydratase n=1 Tax=Geomicrobium sp. JCM 19037 TaxID=1460634 RepID=UPI00045F0FD1|nr:acyl dehydratase [Geomicrobium sp. JCM 19037]GAK03922.1 hypothetical protein JCM19037_2283 [Geomicrobium sp. JCM 19037]
MNERYWEDVQIGEALRPETFHLSVYRLVMAAGATRDFNSIHHNSEYARQSGAEDMYANNVFLQGMWEKTVRAYIRPAGTIRRLKGFKMKTFNTAGETVTTNGTVVNKWIEEGTAFVEIKLWTENADGITVGPGTMIVTLPLKN